MIVLSLLINFMDKTQQTNAYSIGNAETLTDMQIMQPNNVYLHVRHKDSSMDTVSMTIVLVI